MGRRLWNILYFLLCLGMSVTERGNGTTGQDNGERTTLTHYIQWDILNVHRDHLYKSYSMTCSQTMIFCMISFIDKN